MLKRFRRLTAAVCVLILAGFSSARVNASMLQFKPMVGASAVKITYTAVINGSTRLGKLSATGITTNVAYADGTNEALNAQTCGTFSLTAFFDLNSGALITGAPGTSQGTTLSVTKKTAGVAVPLFVSDQVILGSVVFTPQTNTNYSFFSFDLMWKKTPGLAGALANASPFPFIGTTVNSYNVLTSAFGPTSKMAYNQPTGITDGVTLFSSTGGTSNTFMTPMPSAAVSGSVLLMLTFVTWSIRRGRLAA